MVLMVPPSSPALVPFVRVLGYSEATPGYPRERVLPSGGMQLLINLHSDEFRTYLPDQRHSGIVLQGPSDRFSIVDTAGQRAVAWVAFRPGGAYPFFGVPSSEARGALVDLEALWGAEAANLRERLRQAPGAAARLRMLEQALVARAPGHPEPVLRYAVAALERGTAVADVIERSGLSAKRFGRLFADYVGLAPKRFARVRRFQRLLKSVVTADEQTDWARLAVECAYYDQAHLIHEFRAFSGLRPTAYRPRSVTEQNHVPLE